MKKFLIVGAVAVSLIAASVSTAEATWRYRTIRFQSLQRGSWTQKEVVKTIRAATARWSVSGGARRAICIARHESGLNEDAFNSNGHGGVYQQDTGYWPGRRDLWGKPHHRWHLADSWHNARANIIVSIRMAHADRDWGQWTTASLC